MQTSKTRYIHVLVNYGQAGTFCLRIIQFPGASSRTLAPIHLLPATPSDEIPTRRTGTPSLTTNTRHTSPNLLFILLNTLGDYI
jgi:hypothetical protein